MGYRPWGLGYTGIGLAAGTMFLLPMTYHHHGITNHNQNVDGKAMVSMDSDVTRDDLMVSGFAPSSHQLPLLFTISGLQGSDYTSTCEGSGTQTLGSSVDQSSSPQLFVSISQAQMVETESFGEWFSGNLLNLLILLCCCGVCFRGIAQKQRQQQQEADGQGQPFSQPGPYQAVPMQPIAGQPIYQGQPIYPGQQPIYQGYQGQ